jgi:tRNA-binding EMAP/Myf-like protein
MLGRKHRVKKIIVTLPANRRENSVGASSAMVVAAAQDSEKTKALSRKGYPAVPTLRNRA